MKLTRPPTFISNTNYHSVAIHNRQFIPTLPHLSQRQFSYGTFPPPHHNLRHIASAPQPHYTHCTRMPRARRNPPHTFPIPGRPFKSCVYLRINLARLLRAVPAHFKFAYRTCQRLDPGLSAPFCRLAHCVLPARISTPVASRSFRFTSPRNSGRPELWCCCMYCVRMPPWINLVARTLRCLL